MSPLESAVAAAELHHTASRMLQVERAILATMSGMQAFNAMSAQMDRIGRLEKVVAAFCDKILSPVAEDTPS